MTNCIKKIIDIIVDVKENEVSAKDLTENSKIIDDIGLDSLELINFVLRIEDEFNIEISFDEFDFSCMKDIKTFSAFINNCFATQKETGVLA